MRLDPQNLERPHMDDIDRRLLRALSANARSTGTALAAASGASESTVSSRLRSLQSRGVVRGYHADLNLDALGVTVQAFIAVRFATIAREDIEQFRDEAPGWPGVLGVFNVAGADDFLLHVAARNASELREFVLEHLAAHPAVAHTETNLIFDHVAGRGIDHLLD